MTPNRLRAGTSRATRHRPLRRGHTKADCLTILRRLSSYLDSELSGHLCREIRRHLGACPNCEVFIASLRQTVELCRNSSYHRASPALKALLRRAILKAAGRS